MKGLVDFLRRYKWHHALAGRSLRSSRENRFSFVSASEPPSKLVPPHILQKCNQIKHIVLSKLKSCVACFPKDNLPADERTALDFLSSQTDFVVSPVDKGGGWFVTPTKLYNNEALRQLCDENFYDPCDNDLTRGTAAKLTRLLRHLHATHFITKREFLALAPPTSPDDRKFYLLPKVHKSSWPNPCMPPGRPIVSDCSSVSRSCASFVEFFLAPIARQLPSYVRDSMHVISLIKNFSLPDDALLFSLDVVSLYTNIPHEEGISCCGRAFLRFPDPRRPDLTLLSMLRVILTSNDFVFNGERFLQTHGTAMGCAFGASYASIFLSEWEDRALLLEKVPSLWLRYIDDILGVWPFSEQELLMFVETLNSFNPHIRVTLTYSSSSIRFLDLELYRNSQRIGYRTGFKPTDSFSILTSNSYHPPHVFKGIIFGQLYRFITHSCTYSDFVNTLHHVQGHWRRQGYSRSFIRTCTKAVLSFTGQSPADWRTGFFPCKCKYCKYGFFTDSVCNGPNPFPILHRICCTDKNIIYLIECKRCHSRYVGETSRKLRTRISEHVLHIVHNDPTFVGQHFNKACSITDFSFTALERAANATKRKKKEERWMRRLNTVAPHGLNTLGQNKKTVHLVLPFSTCSGSVTRVCQSLARDVTTVASFTAAKNLRTVLRPKRF